MNTAEEVTLEKRREQAWELHVEGLSYRQIAAALGVSLGTVASDFKAMLARIQCENEGQVERERKTALARNARQLAVLLPLVDAARPEKLAGLSDEDKKPILSKALSAIDRIQPLEKRRADLLGLDAPKVVEATVAGVTLDELDARRRVAEDNDVSGDDDSQAESGRNIANGPSE